MMSTQQVAGEEIEEKRLASVREFYRGRDVLVTGGTGFLGKVLVEKLLRACPDIGTLYLVVRAKRGRTAHQRLQQLLDLDFFNRLHEENPTARNKVVAIEGDLSDPNFALNERDRELLTNVVSVVFHSAATIKFDEELKTAVGTNVRGTKHMIDIAKSIKYLKAFVYISTAYSNSERYVIEEKYYPPLAPHGFWKDLIAAADKMDRDELNALSPSLIGKLPNNYTFTKQIAESLVYDHKDEIPVVIYRPSIVVGAFEEPYPGWTDNVNGAVGMIAVCYTGVLNLVLATEDNTQDYIGVDFAVNGAIAAAVQRAQRPKGNCDVYNSATGKYSRTLAQLTSFLRELRYKVPTEKTVWRQRPALTTSELWFNINFLLCRVLPALFVDVILKFKGVKFSTVRMCRKIFVMCRVLKFFTLTSFDIRNENLTSLYDNMSPEDQKTFNFYLKNLNERSEELMTSAVLGVKRYILKDDMSEENIQKLKKRTKYYDWADMVTRIMFYAVVTNVTWKLYSYFTI